MTPEIQLEHHTNAGGDAGGGGGSQTKQSVGKMDSSIHVGEPKSADRKSPKKLTLVPLMFLIYFEVAGGPYGAEPAVQAAGALYAVLGFLIFPFIWSIPESLVTAELATAMPGNGGFIIWADRAFGPICGSLMGTWKLISGVINSAAFPALCVDYIARVWPALSGGGPRYAMLTGMVVVLSFVNYTGLSIVGYTAVALGLVSLAPFVLMTAIAVPKLRPERWLRRGPSYDWRLFFNTLFWNLNFWDNASTMAGEVDRPERTFPTALLGAGLMTSLGYLLPLMAGTGAIDDPQDKWGGGYFADAAAKIAGRWLRVWVEVGAVLSAIGLYEAQLSSCAYQLLGMADLALLPTVFRSRAKRFGTPWAGILSCSVVTLVVSFMPFNDIINSANFLYSLGMLMEFASFLWLRRKEPDLKRPYRVPLRLPALVALCLLPSAFLVFVMVISSWKVFVLSAGMTGFGLLVYYLMEFCKARAWLEFARDEKDGNAGDGAAAASAPSHV